MPDVPPGIVDSHVHLLPERLARKIRAFFENHISVDDLAYPIDHEVVLTALHEAGVDTIWSLPYAHKPGVAEGMNKSSAEIMQQHAAHPVKIVGAATVHPGDSDPAGVVRQALDAYGLKVLKLHCTVGNFSPDDPTLHRVWEVVAERRMPVVIHLGHAVSGHTQAGELAPLERVAQIFPEVRFIIAHCGHRAVKQALTLVEQYPNVYADLTPVIFEPVAIPAERAQQLASKLLFGSDAPNVGLTLPELINHVKNLGLDEAAQHAILGGTARRLISEVLM